MIFHWSVLSFTELREEPVPWLITVMYGVLTSVFFYVTGHQATIPTIRFDSAFTGFHGDFNYHFIPASLITLNTFAGPVFFTLAWPLLLFWPHLYTAASQAMAGANARGKAWRGDFKLFDNGPLLRINLFKSGCRLMLVQAVKVRLDFFLCPIVCCLMVEELINFISYLPIYKLHN